MLHNLLVQAFAAGVDHAMSPLPANILLTGPDAAAAVGALLAGAGRKYAENICLNPGVAAYLKD